MRPSKSKARLCRSMIRLDSGFFPIPVRSLDCTVTKMISFLYYLSIDYRLQCRCFGLMDCATCLSTTSHWRAASPCLAKDIALMCQSHPSWTSVLTTLCWWRMKRKTKHCYLDGRKVRSQTLGGSQVVTVYICFCISWVFSKADVIWCNSIQILQFMYV